MSTRPKPSCAECLAHGTGGGGGMGGGGMRGKNKFVYPKWASHFWLSIQKFRFSPEDSFFGFGRAGGWVVWCTGALVPRPSLPVSAAGISTPEATPWARGEDRVIHLGISDYTPAEVLSDSEPMDVGDAAAAPLAGQGTGAAVATDAPEPEAAADADLSPEAVWFEVSGIGPESVDVEVAGIAPEAVEAAVLPPPAEGSQTTAVGCCAAAAVAAAAAAAAVVCACSGADTHMEDGSVVAAGEDKEQVCGHGQAIAEGEPPPGGGVRGQQRVCVPEIGLRFLAPLINFIFPLRKIILMWVRVGGSAGAGQGPKRGGGFTKQ